MVLSHRHVSLRTRFVNTPILNVLECQRLSEVFVQENIYHPLKMLQKQSPYFYSVQR